MTKNSFFIFIMVLVIGFSIWFTRFGKDIKKTQDLVVEQQEKTQRVLRRETNLALQEQSVALRIAVQQMAQNIVKQEQEIKVNQDELSYWLYNNGDITQKDERV